ncbi:MAG TPA: aminotransferase class V-fold PLP-dependent enzyme [Planctomycetaceae bacterium]|nr:aminotransferase class V-fold PLP-dependent enzyme [Planctomycetaceae bacterium]
MAGSTDPCESGHPFWERWRQQMPVARRWAYLDHAAVSPLPEPARQAIVRWAEEAATVGDVAWKGWSQQVEQLRLAAARWVGADPEEIALVGSTTEGITLVAEGFPWKEGDNVVTLADEFPSNQYPWLNLADRGVETRRVRTDGGRVDMDRLAEAIDRRTGIVTVSWVGYASGWRNDLDRLAALAHERGALLFVDAIQGLGAFDLDVRRTPIDFFAADGHKWMLGPEGAGLFFVRRRHLDLLRPIGVGWSSVVHARDYDRIELRLKPSASRYEGGSRNMAGLIGLGESVRLLSRLGAGAIQRRVLEITDLACQRLQRLGAIIHSDRSSRHKSGIVSFEVPGCDPSTVRRRCLDARVVLSCRGGRLRISPHGYNSEEDIDRLIAVVAACQRAG